MGDVEGKLLALSEGKGREERKEGRKERKESEKGSLVPSLVDHPLCFAASTKVGRKERWKERRERREAKEPRGKER